VLNGFELTAPVDAAERTFLALAAGTLSRPALGDWIERFLSPFHFDSTSRDEG
jgi:prophage maintenance system killer protein